MCGVPSNCQIDSSGKCKWFLKQIEGDKNAKKEENPNVC
jgi:hypothetical protein